MDIESINKQIQTEKDSYNRDKNRLQQKLLTLKQRHQRRLSDLQKQKEQATNQNTNESIYLALNNLLKELLLSK
ncbi:MAG: hypothetical protein ACI37Q_01605 [Candidatus Gastranaerophilaceae bacterium]